jgi:lipid II:glycine glycyltransferase (peptidoglycan interpeptide bridge formation enzyme)
MMEKGAKKVIELFDRTTQLWTTLEEDDRVQQLDQQEEEINTAMKTLQTELKTMHKNNKQTRKSQLEPLQEKATQIIVELEEEKTRMAQDHAESAESLREHIIAQRIEELTDKVVQAREKGEELEGKFHILAKAVQGACTT